MLALPWGEVVILAASVLALIALVWVVVAVLRHRISTSRAFLGVIIVLLVPFAGALFVVWALATAARVSPSRVRA